jgi:hypothetical protein
MPMLRVTMSELVTFDCVRLGKGEADDSLPESKVFSDEMLAACTYRYKLCKNLAKVALGTNHKSKSHNWDAISNQIN